jgi:hypothetical protein
LELLQQGQVLKQQHWPEQCELELQQVFPRVALPSFHLFAFAIWQRVI